MPHDDTPATQFLTDFHAYRWQDGIEVHLEKFKEGSDSFSALVTFLWRQKPGVEGDVLATRRLNLHAPTTITTTSKMLAGRRAGVDQKRWESRLEDVAYQSWQRYQEGDSILLHADEIEIDYSVAGDIIPGLWASNGVTLDYGDGEAGKSTLVLAQGLTVVTGRPILGIEPTTTGPVIYFDWEDGERTFHERLSALCRPLGIPVPHDFLYRRMDRSVASGEVRIRREVEENGCAAAIFDSVGEMLGGDPSDPTLVIAAINAMKRVGVPALGIHHITGEQAKSKSLNDKKKPYGSIYARTGSRMMWLVEGFEEGENTKTVYMHNTKSNRGQRRKPLAWTVEYENTGDPSVLSELRYSPRTTSDYYERIQEDVPASEMSVKDAIRAVLKSGGGNSRTYAQIREGVEKLRGSSTTDGTVRTKTNELVKEGFASRIEGDEVSFGLRSAREMGF